MKELKEIPLRSTHPFISPISFIFLISLFLGSLACNTLLPPRPVLTWDPSPTALIIRASSCCGLVPNTFVDNYIPDAQLFGDGRLVWAEMDANSQRRVLTATLTPAQMEALLDSFADAGFFGWNAQYADYSITDIPNTCLRVNLQASTHEVCEYYRGAPQAFHRLFNELASGAGQPGTDYVPQRGYLTAYPLSGDPAAPTNWQWPAEAVGVSLADAANGVWIDGPALELAWSITNANHWNTLVQDGVNYFEITVTLPDISWVEPPAGP